MRKAFTLSEVLITLGIIGVVAAITMPTLIQNHQKRSLEVATKKFYSMMSQAIRQYMADEGVDDLRNTPIASDNYESWASPEAITSIRNFVTKYLKVIKECGATECFAERYKLLDGTIVEQLGNFTTDWFYNQGYRDFVLSDGSVIRVGYHYNFGPVNLFVDVNGKKGPNRVGYDLWSMSIFYDGVIDESNVTPEARNGDSWCKPSECRESRFDGVCDSGGYGGCFGHFLENGFKFDY